MLHGKRFLIGIRGHPNQVSFTDNQVFTLYHLNDLFTNNPNELTFSRLSLEASDLERALQLWDKRHKQ